MSYDAFISHASRDKVVAAAVCDALERAQLRCWIAPRDIAPGTSYGAQIVQALEVTKVLVLVLSDSANKSPHVIKEVERAVAKSVRVLPFRVEDVRLNADLEFFVSSQHWLDASAPPIDQHFVRLVEAVHPLVRASQPPAAACKLDRKAARGFDEVAPDDWRSSTRSPWRKWLDGMLSEKF